MADETKGAGHFRTSLEKGLEILDNLRGHTSGLAIPHFVIDVPGGGGKIPMLPKYILHRDESKIILRNYKNEHFIFHEPHSGDANEDKKPIQPSITKLNNIEVKMNLEEIILDNN